MKATGTNFFSSMWDFFAKRFLISAGAYLVLLLGSAGQMHAQTYPTLPTCGFEGGRPCHGASLSGFGPPADWEFIVNGGARCDRGLKPQGPLLSPTTCVNDTRQQASVDPWTDFALRNQENLGIDEPINWVSRLATHNAYNTVADGYIDGNQYWSMTDQLRQGSRHFQLDLHWVNNHLRLCHGHADGFGCSPFDRLYAYGIKEIADWLDQNPTEIMTIDFEDYGCQLYPNPCTPEQGHDSYVNDPLAAYFGSKILTPEEWPMCPVGVTCAPNYKTRMPTKREMLAAGKQVFVLTSSGDYDTHGGKWIFSSNLVFGNTTAGAVVDCPNPLDACASGVPNVDFDPLSRHCYYGIATNPPGFNVFDLGNEVATLDIPHLAQFSFIGEDRAFGPVNSPLNTWITEAWVGRAVNCRISLVGIDDVRQVAHWAVPDLPPNDHRHQAAVWSWFEGDAGNSGDAALLLHNLTPPAGGNCSGNFSCSPSNRWVSRNATDGHPFMCARPRSESGGPPESWADFGEGFEWRVTSGSGTWFEGGQRCLAEFGPGFVFSVPVSGYQNEQASRLIAFSYGRDAWINYNDIKSPGVWDINRRPIADAGHDQTVECNAPGTGTVTVDGSASHDPDGDSLTYAWTGTLGSATGPVATIKAPMGVSTIRLVVDDGYSGVGSADMRVTVRDTIPPVIRSAAANPTSSWPPNHKMFPVRLSVDAHDTCDPNPRSRVVSVTSNEGTSADWQIVGPLEVLLRSERSGNGGDRVYTIWIQSTDASGNASKPRGVTVTIAHDQGKSKP